MVSLFFELPKCENLRIESNEKTQAAFR